MKEEMNEITIDQIALQIKLSKMGVITQEHLRRFLLEPSDSPVFPITVDYSRSIGEMVAATNRTQINSYIAEAYKTKTKGGIIKKKSMLIPLDNDTSESEALGLIERKNLLPAKLEEVLAFGEIYPELTRMASIFCVGSCFYLPNTTRCIPAISHMSVGLRPFDDDNIPKGVYILGVERL